MNKNVFEMWWPKTTTLGKNIAIELQMSSMIFIGLLNFEGLPH